MIAVLQLAYNKLVHFRCVISPTGVDASSMTSANYTGSQRLPCFDTARLGNRAASQRTTAITSNHKLPLCNTDVLVLLCSNGGRPFAFSLRESPLFYNFKYYFNGLENNHDITCNLHGKLPVKIYNFGNFTSLQAVLLENNRLKIKQKRNKIK